MAATAWIRPLLASLLLVSVRAAAIGAEVQKPGRTSPLQIGDGVLLVLKEGRKTSGLYKGERDGAIWLGIDGGEIAVERSLVIEIRRQATDDGEFRKRHARLNEKDVEAHWQLALWAKRKGLETTARSEAECVIRLKSDHGEARGFLGHKFRDGRWMTHDEAMVSQGFVQYKGEWVTQGQFVELNLRRR